MTPPCCGARQTSGARVWDGALANGRHWIESMREYTLRNNDI